jgi:hypothetical protein
MKHTSILGRIGVGALAVAMLTGGSVGEAAAAPKRGKAVATAVDVPADYMRHGRRHYRRANRAGPAVAASIIGGVLGAAAIAASRPRYYDYGYYPGYSYGYPAYGGYYPYGGVSYGYSPAYYGYRRSYYGGYHAPRTYGHYGRGYRYRDGSRYGHRGYGGGYGYGYGRGGWDGWGSAPPPRMPVR